WTSVSMRVVGMADRVVEQRPTGKGLAFGAPPSSLRAPDSPGGRAAPVVAPDRPYRDARRTQQRGPHARLTPKRGAEARESTNHQPGISGKKIGRTQIFDDKGEGIRCTVVQAGCVVVGKRTLEKDGYSALVLGWGERKEKHTNKPLAGQFKKAGITPKR